MRLRVFHAGDGDCLLLTSKDGRHALIDGGRGETFRTETWPILVELAKEKKRIDLVVVSHIDADHISGILWLMKLVAAWTRYDHQTTAGNNPGFPAPEVTRPPEIRRLWHNSWRAQLGDLAEPIEGYLCRVGLGLEMVDDDVSKLPPPAADMIEALTGLVESIPQGVDLLRVVDDDTPVPRNDPFENLVLLRDPPHVEKLGKTKLTVIGPARKHLEKLREEWREWLTGPGGAPIEALGLEPWGQGLALGSGFPFTEAGFAERAQGEELVAELISTAAKVIVETDPTKVTPPNRASITLLAEEDDRTCLLTGDSAEEEILEGLEAAGQIVDGRCWCNVVKVQHHGSEHNLSQAFAGTVLADHYVLCGDGASGNPNPDVIKTIVETRRTADTRPFTIWFNTSSRRTLPTRRKALRAAIRVATSAAAKHPTIKVKVLERGKSHEISV